ncbi:MAG: hypothetical protein UW18_C0017G0004 [Microgenomates group bacterium GW2011_GWF1_44_10]|nr:MAG: hypothetical protein UW18_C0017G0004 [Microgenomates group bacterium GW2011_GWF1_44_10]
MKEIELQIKVIEAFLEDEDISFGYGVLEQETGATRAELKLIVERLKKLDMIKPVKGLMNDDGEVVGSGWGLTQRATQKSIREWLVDLKNL